MISFRVVATVFGTHADKNRFDTLERGEEEV